jgi:predicted metal-binding protein
MINKVVYVFFLVSCFSTVVFAEEADQLLTEASNKLSTSDYQDALELYQQAFLMGDGNAFDFYRAACAASLCENCIEREQL